ncbi:hypothetical protein ABMX62_20365 [Vibrio vulnificus]|uniref:hypothetical protein n=1 Tax=Vibrio vulnificus TaxID=672 RepID=UPI004059F27C
MHSLNKISISLLALAISPIASATVCTDPAGLGQIINQSANDMWIWLEEKAQRVSEMNFDYVLSELQMKSESYNGLVSTQNITEAQTNTANLAMQAKFQPSPNICGNIASATAYIQSLDDAWCEADSLSSDFVSMVSQGCKEGDSSCATPYDRTVDEVAKIVAGATVTHGSKKTIDGTKVSLSGLLPGFSEGGYSKTPEESERIKSLLQLTFVNSRPSQMPTDPDGSPIGDDSTPEAKAAFANWLRDINISTAAYNTALRVSTITDPREVNGQTTRSVLETIVDQVNFYNSPEMIRKLGNGADKSCMRIATASIKTEKDMELWRNSRAGQACMAQFTSTEMVTRYIGEMSAVGLQLDKMILESNLSIEFQSALQTQLLHEIAKKRGS